MDRRELHQAFLGEWDDVKKKLLKQCVFGFSGVKIKIENMDKHLCCTFSWKIHDGGIRKLIVNSWEETYTHGSTIQLVMDEPQSTTDKLSEYQHTILMDATHR